MRISDEEKDTGLKDKLMAEAPGILAWIVSGAMAYIENGLQDPQAVREATQEYQTDSDPIGDFIANYLEIRSIGDDACYVAASDLQAAWSIYCEQEQVTGVRYKDLPARLKAQYGKSLINQRTKKIDRSAVRAWIGLTLNDAGEDLAYRYQAVV